MRGLLTLLCCAWLLAGCSTPTPATANPDSERNPAAAATQPPPPTAAATQPPPDAETTASGLVTQLLKAGNGEQRPTLQDKVRVHFTAWNTRGEVTDGSEARGGPVVFEVGGVIAGWTEALQQMRVGERRRLWVPNHLAYPGRPGYPRPAAMFEIELVEILAGPPALPAPSDVAAAPGDARKTKSGLAYKLLGPTTGRKKPRAWDHVTLHYAGWTPDGRMFARSPDKPARFALSAVLPGWREGLLLLSEGERARFWLPESLAFQGRVGEPSGSVVYDIELVSVEPQSPPPRAPKDIAAPPRDAKHTDSGLAYRIVHKGPGSARPRPDDKVKLHYSAWQSDGTMFDSSLVRGAPATVPLKHIIPGWAEGLQLMAEGDKALLWIPEPLAYGGRDGAPKGMLVYEVELLEVAPRADASTAQPN